MTLSEVLSDFARETDAGEFVAGGDGVYHLEIDDVPVSLRVDAETGGLVTQGEVAWVSVAARKRLCRILLESMYLWAGTGGSSFVVEPGSERLLLQRVDPLEFLDSAGFKAMLEAFANELDSWRSMVAGFESVGEALDAEQAEAAERERQTALGLSGWLRG